MITERKRRPISVKLQTHEDTDGITLKEANRLHVTPCDAAFVVTVLYEGDKTVLATSSYDGESRQAMSGQGLYEMWVAMAGYLMGQLRDEVPEEKKRKFFLQTVLSHWQRNQRTVELPDDVVAEGTAVPEPATR